MGSQPSASISLVAGFSRTTVVAIVISSAAMVATLPGRTHGLGLVTEPLLTALNLDRVPFAALNFWATIIGAGFCLAVGWLIDRLGVRVVLTGVLISLGLVVVAMTWVKVGGREVWIPIPGVVPSGNSYSATVPMGLFVLILLTRGLGQSALSVVSLALVGKAVGNRPGVVIGIYSFLVAVGFMSAFAAVKAGFENFQADWKVIWAGMGWILVGFGVTSCIFVRNEKFIPFEPGEPSCHSTGDMTLTAALLTPGFWVFSLATSFYGLVAAGMSLFNQSLLEERGFDRSVFLTITSATPLVGLAANLISGWLATRVRLGSLLCVGLVIQTTALALFPFVSSLSQVYAYAAAMGVAGGVLTVVFFTVWRQAFGATHLGKIQGVAQLLTVLASATGPLILAAGQKSYGSYGPVVQALGLVAAIFALAAYFVPLPNSKLSNLGTQP